MLMTVNERNEFMKRLFEDCIAVMEAKASDYSEGGTKLANDNIRLIGTVLGESPYRAWTFGFVKHFVAILGWINGHRQNRAESIKSRIIDAINYLVILASLIVEDDKLHD